MSMRSAPDLHRCRTTLREESVPFTDVLAYPYGGFPRNEPMRSNMKAMFSEEGLQLALRIGSRVERTTPKDPYEMRPDSDGRQRPVDFDCGPSFDSDALGCEMQHAAG